MIGTTLAHYRITAKLGAGGMGEVYKATDLQLGRDVAIKILPDTFVSDPERLQRFEREAKLLAQLNHPNIAHVYGLETSGQTHALVMELVEGPTLAERLEHGPLPFDESLAISLQIAQALEEAHEKGIVHRDLKPQNIKASMEGKVKVLDFGLAKAMDPVSASSVSASKLAHSPTITLGATVQGVILGTAAYMAPEQARGLAVDERADVWSFGVVLYEMVTGIQPFVADTVPDTLARVLTRDVDLAALPASIPRGLRDLLRRCLSKTPRQRLHAIADARIALEDLLAGASEASVTELSSPSGQVPPVRRARPSAWLPWLVGALAGIVFGAGLSVFVFGRSAPATRSAAAAAPAAFHTLVASGDPANPTVSRDGRTLAFSAIHGGVERVWIKDLNSGSESPIGPVGSSVPRFAPDGTSLLYVTPGARSGDLYRMALATRESRLVARDAIWGDWSPDGRSVVLRRRRPAEGIADSVVLVDLESGRERVLASAENQFLQDPQFSPSGNRIAVCVTGQNAGTSDVVRILETSSGATRDHLLRLPGLEGLLVSAHTWVSETQIALLVRNTDEARSVGSLLVLLDLETDRTKGLLPIPLDGFGLAPAGPGSLVVSLGSDSQGLVETRRGTNRGWSEKAALTEGPFHDRQPVYSPDGKWIVFSSDRSGNLDLWRLSRESGEMQRLTDDPADDWDPGISPDGTKVIFSSNRSGRYQIWIAEADGSSPRRITDVANAQNPTMTADGAWIVYSIEGADLPESGLWKCRPDGSESTRVLAGHFFHPDTSPDGRFVALMTTGTRDLRVVRLADGRQIPASLPSSDRYRWSVEDRAYLWGVSYAKNLRGIARLPFDATSESFGTPQVVISTPGETPETLGVARDGSALTSSTLSSVQGAILRIDGLGDLAHR